MCFLNNQTDRKAEPNEMIYTRVPQNFQTSLKKDTERKWIPDELSVIFS